jgi:MFS family permease
VCPQQSSRRVVENVSVVLRSFRASPLTAGLLLTTVPIALGLVAPLSGGLSDRLGPQPLIVSGMVLAAAAPVGLALVVRTTALLPLLIPLVAFGVGQGLFTAPNNSAIRCRGTLVCYWRPARS